jgi:hypothetical protein
MESCRYIDYSNRDEAMIPLAEFSEVTREHLVRLRDLIAPDQFQLVEPGDRLGIYFIDNRVEMVQGVLTVWHNKDLACLERGIDRIWGEWVAGDRLVLTEEFKLVEDEQGGEEIGRIAYNAHGVRGRYLRGRFYTLFGNRDFKRQEGML